MFVFSDGYSDTSSVLKKVFGDNASLKKKATNFSVYDITDAANPVKIQYAFIDRPGKGQDTLSNFDVVMLSNDDGSKLSWRITFQGNNAAIPGQGDTLKLYFMQEICV